MDDFEDDDLGNESPKKGEKIDRKALAAERKLKCLSVSQIRTLFEEAKSLFSQRHPNDPVENALYLIGGGFFVLAWKRFPEKFIFGFDLATALGLDRTSQVGYFVKYARKRIREHGLLLSNKFGIGYKIATPSEAIQEFLKANVRGCGHLHGLLASIGVIHWDQKKIDEISSEDMAMLKLSFEVANLASKFLKAQGKKMEDADEKTKNNINNLQRFVGVPVFKQDSDKFEDVLQ